MWGSIKVLLLTQPSFSNSKFILPYNALRKHTSIALVGVQKMLYNGITISLYFFFAPSSMQQNLVSVIHLGLLQKCTTESWFGCAKCRTKLWFYYTICNKIILMLYIFFVFFHCLTDKNNLCIKSNFIEISTTYWDTQP